MNRKAYTYLIGWRQQDIWYYGVRCANTKDPVDDLWNVYFTSSKYVKDYRRLYGEPDVVRVHRIFETPSEALWFEERFLRKVGAVNSNRWLNRANAGKEFNTVGAGIDSARRATLSKLQIAILTERLGFESYTEMQNHFRSRIENGETAWAIAKSLKMDPGTVIKHSGFEKDDPIFKKNFKRAYTGKQKSTEHRANMKKPKSIQHREAMRTAWVKRRAE